VVAQLEAQLTLLRSENQALMAKALASEAAAAAARRKLARTEEQLALVAAEADRQAVKLHAQTRLDHGARAHSPARLLRPSSAHVSSPAAAQHRHSPQSAKRSTPAAAARPRRHLSAKGRTRIDGSGEPPSSVSKRMLDTGRVSVRGCKAPAAPCAMPCHCHVY
jgi:hypothetical protein